jgi:hypothetical protein
MRSRTYSVTTFKIAKETALSAAMRVYLSNGVSGGFHQ